MKGIHLLFINFSDMMHINYTTSKVDKIGKNPTIVQLTSGEIYLRRADLGITANRWQDINLWRLPETSVKKIIPESCQEKLLVFSKN
jgi:hypothetical protein